MCSLHGQPIFDFHARLVRNGNRLDELLRTMRQAGIERAAVAAGGVIPLAQLSRQIVEGGSCDVDADNAGILESCRRSGGRLQPVFFANPHRGVDHYLRDAGDFAALELAPAVSGIPLTDERTVGLVLAASEIGHPVYLHCLAREGFRIPDLVAVAASVPGATLVLAHSGIGHIDVYGVQLIESQMNILLETSGGYTHVLRFALERLGPARLLFGSEFPLQDPEVELAKYRSVAISPAAWRQVAWENASRLLGV